MGLNGLVYVVIPLETTPGLWGNIILVPNAPFRNSGDMLCVLG